MAQLVAHLVRDQEVAGSSPVIQTVNNEALTAMWAPLVLYISRSFVAVSVPFNCYITLLKTGWSGDSKGYNRYLILIIS